MLKNTRFPKMCLYLFINRYKSKPTYDAIHNLFFSNYSLAGLLIQKLRLLLLGNLSILINLNSKIHTKLIIKIRSPTVNFTPIPCKTMRCSCCNLLNNNWDNNQFGIKSIILIGNVLSSLEFFRYLVCMLQSPKINEFVSYCI